MTVLHLDGRGAELEGVLSLERLRGKRPSRVPLLTKEIRDALLSEDLQVWHLLQDFRCAGDVIQVGVRVHEFDNRLLRHLRYRVHDLARERWRRIQENDPLASGDEERLVAAIGHWVVVWFELFDEVTGLRIHREDACCDCGWHRREVWEGGAVL